MRQPRAGPIDLSYSLNMQETRIRANASQRPPFDVNSKTIKVAHGADRIDAALKVASNTVLRCSVECKHENLTPHRKIRIVRLVKGIH